MTTRLLLARVGAGKTQAIQERLAAVKREKPLAKVWVLLSGERQITAFRQRLMERDPSSRVFFNIEFFSFYTLYTRLLADAGRPQRCLDEAARTGLIRVVCAREPLNVYERIAHTAGFVRIMGDFIYELKQNLITPEALEAAAATEKERELARIYAAYQRLLQDYDLVDREGEGWQALEALRALPSLGTSVDLLLADGFDQFNVLQATLLTQLGDRARESIVTLTTVPGREATIGKRFARARERLRHVHEQLGAALEESEYSAYHDARPPALRHLSEHIFLPKAGETEHPLPVAEAASNSGENSADVPVHLLEAPDVTREAGAVLRRVKALLLSGCRPDDVLIALRDWMRYGEVFAALGRSYGIPLALHMGMPLAQSPIIVALLDLLQLHASDFRRRELLDTLRSPYFDVPGMPEGGVDLLDRLSASMMITGGRDAWLDALDAVLASSPTSGLSDEDDEAEADFPPELVSATLGALTAFFEAVTPPDQGSVEDYVRWLDGLIGDDNPDPDSDAAGEADDDDVDVLYTAYTLNVPQCLRQTAAPGVVERDLAAMSALVSALRGMVSAGTLYTALGYEHGLTRAEFLAELRLLVASGTVQRRMARDGRVLVTTVTDARGLPHEHVFLVGLSEGIFPAPVPEDPLLLDSERKRLAAHGVELSTQADRTDDDGLFYELLNQAYGSLTLSRPYTKDGAPWPESHLWRAVRALFPDAAVSRLRVGAVVPAGEAVTLQEIALAVADGSVYADPLRRWLKTAHPDYWQRIALGRRVETSRMSRQPYDRYAGRLRSDALIARVADALGSKRVWSATQLGEYGMCGFRFFARRLLRLEALREPEEGMDNRQLGTLYHEILEATYNQVAKESLTVTPDNLPRALELLREKAAALLRDAPRRLGFRASALWEQEKDALVRRLEALVQADFAESSPIDKAFASAEPRRPYRFEVPFGEDGAFAITLDGERLRVRGVIDRVDWQGDRVIVIDYKTGSTKIPTTEVARGRNFQMMLYLLAAEAAFDAQEVGGAFWHLGSREISGDMSSLRETDLETIAAAKGHLERQLALGRAGDFATQANKLEDGRCAHYCDFHQMCRMSITAKRKREA